MNPPSGPVGASSHGPPPLGGPVGGAYPSTTMAMSHTYVHPQNQLPAFPQLQSPPQLQPTVEQPAGNAAFPVVNQQGKSAFILLYTCILCIFINSSIMLFYFI